MSRFDDLFGDPAVDPKLAEGLVRRVPIGEDDDPREPA
jgi:hypothetical protein